MVAATAAISLKISQLSYLMQNTAKLFAGVVQEEALRPEIIIFPNFYFFILLEIKHTINIHFFSFSFYRKLVRVAAICYVN